MKNWETIFDQVFNRRDLETKTKIQEDIDQQLYNQSKTWHSILFKWLKQILLGR